MNRNVQRMTIAANGKVRGSVFAKRNSHILAISVMRLRTLCAFQMRRAFFFVQPLLHSRVLVTFANALASAQEEMLDGARIKLGRMLQV